MLPEWYFIDKITDESFEFSNESDEFQNNATFFIY